MATVSLWHDEGLAFVMAAARAAGVAPCDVRFYLKSSIRNYAIRMAIDYEAKQCAVGYVVRHSTPLVS